MTTSDEWSSSQPSRERKNAIAARERERMLKGARKRHSYVYTRPLVIAALLVPGKRARTARQAKVEHAPCEENAREESRRYGGECSNGRHSDSLQVGGTPPLEIPLAYLGTTTA